MGGGSCRRSRAMILASSPDDHADLGERAVHTRCFRLHSAGAHPDSVQVYEMVRRLDGCHNPATRTADIRPGQRPGARSKEGALAGDTSQRGCSSQAEDGKDAVVCCCKRLQRSATAVAVGFIF